MVFRTDLLLVSLTETLHTYDCRWLRGHVIFFVTCSKLRRKVAVWYKTTQMWVLFDVAAVPCFFNLIVNDLWYKHTFYRAVTSWTLKSTKTLNAFIINTLVLWARLFQIQTMYTSWIMYGRCQQSQSKHLIQFVVTCKSELVLYICFLAANHAFLWFSSFKLSIVFHIVSTYLIVRT